MGLIGIDFDFTIWDSERGVPYKDSKRSIMLLREKGHKILIHSCNNKSWIEKCLSSHEIPFDYIWDGKGKPNCDAFVDDRGIGFRGNWDETLEEIFSLVE